VHPPAEELSFLAAQELQEARPRTVRQRRARTRVQTGTGLLSMTKAQMAACLWANNAPRTSSSRASPSASAWTRRETREVESAREREPVARNTASARAWCLPKNAAATTATVSTSASLTPAKRWLACPSICIVSSITTSMPLMCSALIGPLLFTVVFQPQ